MYGSQQGSQQQAGQKVCVALGLPFLRGSSSVGRFFCVLTPRDLWQTYQDDSLRPVTIKQVLDAEEAYPGSSEFRIDGASVTQVRLPCSLPSSCRLEPLSPPAADPRTSHASP